MAFVKIEKPDRSELLRDIETVGQISDSQLHAEVSFWEDVRRGEGFLAPQAVIMIGYVLGTTVDAIRRYAALPSAQKESGQRLSWRIPLSDALAGLALTQLLRRAYGSAERVEEWFVTPPAPAMDFELGESIHNCRMHHPCATLEQILPAYEVGNTNAWYQDGPLIVKTYEPADPSPRFSGLFRTSDGARLFDPAEHITLVPQLTSEYVKRPEV